MLSVRANIFNYLCPCTTTFGGANVNATDTLAMEVGGDLTVESLQDSDYAKGNGWGMGLSAGVGVNGNDGKKGKDSAGIGFNIGGSDRDSLWVNDMTELTGSKVDISVSGKTTLTGAKIAAGEYDENGNFVDNGKLSLSTGEMEYHDYQNDSNESSAWGIGIAASLGGSAINSEQSEHPSGSTSLTLKDTGEEKEQITRATIGNGSITVGGDSNPDLTGLNRDTANAQEITKDMKTGVLNSKLTVDNNQLLNDPMGILTNPWNAPNTTIGLVNGLANIGYGVITNDPVTAVITDDGILRITGGKLNINNGAAISLGNVVTYYGAANPDDEAPTYEFNARQKQIYEKYGIIITPTDNDKTIRKGHEEIGGHVSQSSILGPLYLPTYLIGGANSTSNPLESWADKSGNQMYKQRNGIE